MKEKHNKHDTTEGQDLLGPNLSLVFYPQGM
jgi:hypothetical protein